MHFFRACMGDVRALSVWVDGLVGLAEGQFVPSV